MYADEELSSVIASYLAVNIFENIVNYISMYSVHQCGKFILTAQTNLQNFCGNLGCGEHAVQVL